METVIVELKHEKAMQLLQDLEALENIRINKNKETNSSPLLRFRSVLLQEDGKNLEAHIKEIREEWNNF